MSWLPLDRSVWRVVEVFQELISCKEYLSRVREPIHILVSKSTLYCEKAMASKSEYKLRFCTLLGEVKWSDIYVRYDRISFIWYVP